MCDTARDNGADIVAVFAGVNKEKGTLNFACACGADAIKLGAHAGNIVRETAKIAGGSGGGKPPRTPPRPTRLLRRLTL